MYSSFESAIHQNDHSRRVSATSSYEEQVAQSQGPTADTRYSQSQSSFSVHSPGTHVSPHGSRAMASTVIQSVGASIFENIAVTESGHIASPMQSGAIPNGRSSRGSDSRLLNETVNSSISRGRPSVTSSRGSKKTKGSPNATSPVRKRRSQLEKGKRKPVENNFSAIVVHSGDSDISDSDVIEDSSNEADTKALARKREEERRRAALRRTRKHVIKRGSQNWQVFTYR